MLDMDCCEDAEVWDSYLVKADLQCIDNFEVMRSQPYREKAS